MKNPQRYTLLLSIAGGHRIFDDKWRSYPYCWAIADESGETPNDTTDGPLWLDLYRSVKFDEDTRAAMIPIKNSCGYELYTPTSPVNGLVIAMAFQLEVDDNYPEIKRKKLQRPFPAKPKQ